MMYYSEERKARSILLCHKVVKLNRRQSWDLMITRAYFYLTKMKKEKSDQSVQ